MGKEKFERMQAHEDKKLPRRQIQQPQFLNNHFDAEEFLHHGRRNLDQYVDAEIENGARGKNITFPWDSPILLSEKMGERDRTQGSSQWNPDQWKNSGEGWFGTRGQGSHVSQVEDVGVGNFAMHSWPGLPMDSSDEVGEQVMLLQRELMHLKNLEREQGGHFWKESHF